MPTGTVIFENEYLSARLEYDGKLVRIIRSAVAFPDPDTLEQAYAPLLAILDKLGRADRCVLSDLRLAPGRNEPAFEAALLRIRRRLFPGFRKSATLVQSKVGLLQISRLIREDRVERLASDNETELLTYLGLIAR